MASSVRGHGAVALLALLLAAAAAAAALVVCAAAAPTTPQQRAQSDDGDAADPYFGFVPEYMATLYANTSVDAATWSGTCFRNVTAQFVKLDSRKAEWRLALHDKSSAMCVELYMLADREQLHFHEFFFEGSHRVDVTFGGAQGGAERADVTANGLQVFVVPGNIAGLVRTAWSTYQLFRQVPSTMPEKLRFLEDHMNVTLRARTAPAVDLDAIAPLLQSGDLLAVQMFKGDDLIIMMGSGSRVGHVVAPLRIDGQLYIAESCDSSCINATRSGVQRTLWADWVAGYHTRQAQENSSVSWLPLAPQYRARFNETAAAQWFLTVEGLPYGLHNFFFGWIDDPEHNLPPPLTWDMVVVLLPVLDKVLGPEIQFLVTDALNQRLGTAGLDVRAVYSAAAARGLSVDQLFALPENDAWLYAGQPSMVCSAFYTRLLTAAGVFAPTIAAADLQGTEFTPRDAYQLAVFDAAFATQMPAACSAGVPSDQQTPWCQLWGSFVLDLPGANSVIPYADMNQRCQSEPPAYARIPINC